MPQPFWIEEYRKKASLPNPVAQSGRGDRFDTVGFLYLVKQVSQLLELNTRHDLLDVGCANGLFDIVLSAQCRSLLAIEPVEELAALARRNLSNCLNVEVKAGHGAKVPAGDSCFDRVLLLDVVQLIPPLELTPVFHELHRVTRQGGMILLGSVPDGARRETFLQGYLADVRRASHLSDTQKDEIIQRNENAFWYCSDDLEARWRELRCEVVRHPLLPIDPNAGNRFHMTVRVGEK